MDKYLLDYEKKKQYFEAFIEEYKEKSLVDKQQTVIRDFKELIALFQNLCIMYKIDHELLLNKELADVNLKDYTQDDFAEAVYVYLQIFKEIMSSFVFPMISSDEEENI